jgi:hypothetical protein
VEGLVKLAVVVVVVVVVELEAMAVVTFAVIKKKAISVTGREGP